MRVISVVEFNRDKDLAHRGKQHGTVPVERILPMELKHHGSSHGEAVEEPLL